MLTNHEYVVVRYLISFNLFNRIEIDGNVAPLPLLSWCLRTSDPLLTTEVYGAAWVGSRWWIYVLEAHQRSHRMPRSSISSQVQWAEPLQRKSHLSSTGEVLHRFAWPQSECKKNVKRYIDSTCSVFRHVHNILGLISLKWTFQLWTIQDRPRRSRRNIYCHHLPLRRPSLVTTTLVVMGFVLASETESDVIMIRGVEDMTSRHIGYANHLANHERLPFHDVNFHSPFPLYTKWWGMYTEPSSEASVYHNRQGWLKSFEVRMILTSNHSMPPKAAVPGYGGFIPSKADF